MSTDAVLSTAILGVGGAITVLVLVHVGLCPAVRSVARLLCRWQRVPLPERPGRRQTRTALAYTLGLAVVDAALAWYVTRSVVLVLVALGGVSSVIVVVGGLAVLLLARREVRRRTSGRAWRTW